MSLKAAALSGVGWTGLAQFARQVAHFVILAVLARLLTPDDFGLIGMIMVFTGFATVIADAGFSSALVQRREISERHISSVYWLNIVAGATMSVAFMLAAPVLADFFREPRLRPLAMLIAINFVIASFSFVQLALLRREMRFKLIAIVETVEVVVSGGVAITLALLGYGVWSLAWQLIVASVALALGFTIVGKWRPRLLFDWSAARELMGYSLNLLGFKTWNYWVRNGDNLLIGKVVGSAALGIYTRAYALMLLPINKVGSVVGRVMFPTLSQIQTDRDRVRKIFLQVNRIIALATFPMMFGLFAVSEPFVLAVFGPKWTATIPVLQLLCLVGVNQSIGTTLGWIYESQGRTDWQFRWGIGSGIFTLAAFAVGVQWGVMGVAWAYLIRTYLLWYPSVAIPGRLIGMTFPMYFRNVGSIWIRSIIMAALVWAAQWVLVDSLQPWTQLAILIPGGALLYLSLLHFGHVEAFREFTDLLRHVRDRRRPQRPAAVLPDA